MVKPRKLYHDWVLPIQSEMRKNKTSDFWESEPSIAEGFEDFLNALHKVIPQNVPELVTEITPENLKELISKAYYGEASEEIIKDLGNHAQKLEDALNQSFATSPEVLEFGFIDIPVAAVLSVGISLIDQTLMYYKREVTAEEWRKNIVNEAKKAGCSAIALAVIITALMIMFPPLAIFLAGIPGVVFESIAGFFVIQKAVKVLIKHKDWLEQNIVNSWKNLAGRIWTWGR